MAENGQERTEQATPRKRKQAREKGTVARSQDLTSSIVLVMLAFMLPAMGAAIAGALMQSMKTGLSFSDLGLQTGDLLQSIWNIAKPAAVACIPLVLVSLVVGTAVSFIQVGFHPTMEPLAPKFERINPLSGFKRLFSRQAAFEFFKTLVKLFLIGFIAWRDVSSSWDGLINLGNLTAGQGAAWVASLVLGIILKIAIAWLVLGLVDYLFQRYTVNKQLMMTMDEVKREMKETETSPELRAEMHRRRQRLAKQRMMSNVKHADVVITNPTEYAVALKYDPKKSSAPLVLAKGRHLIAEKIRDEAKKHRVMIVPNPPLARSLYDEVEVGESIPSNLFQAVAEVLAYVFKLKGKKL